MLYRDKVTGFPRPAAARHPARVRREIPAAYRHFLTATELGRWLHEILKGLDTRSLENLQQRGSEARHAILVEEGIDTISLNPDTTAKTTLAILEKEKARKK
jgi:phosphoenolpyruvate synthase/pyruvate phosphate dikinase